MSLREGHSDFEIAVDGDLTGQIITATLTRSVYVGLAKPESHDDFFIGATSEFSNPLRVER